MHPFRRHPLEHACLPLQYPYTSYATTHILLADIAVYSNIGYYTLHFYIVFIVLFQTLVYHGFGSTPSPQGPNPNPRNRQHYPDATLRLPAPVEAVPVRGVPCLTYRTIGSPKTRGPPRDVGCRIFTLGLGVHPEVSKPHVMPASMKLSAQ